MDSFPLISPTLAFPSTQIKGVTGRRKGANYRRPLFVLNGLTESEKEREEGEREKAVIELRREEGPPVRRDPREETMENSTVDDITDEISKW